MEIGNHDSTTAGMDGFKVVVPAHPLISHWVSVLQDQATPSHAFKSAMGELGRLLIYKATRDWLPTVKREIQSLMGTAVVESVNPMEPIMVVPILRAGLALAEFAPSILPSTRTFHLGMARDETTLQPSVYLNKFKRKQFPVRLSFAMTINKVQGQNIPNVGVYLPEPVFSHGQLYVALSRAIARSNIKILAVADKEKDKGRKSKKTHGNLTKNIVYREVLTS